MAMHTPVTAQLQRSCDGSTSTLHTNASIQQINAPQPHPHPHPRRRSFSPPRPSAICTLGQTALFTPTRLRRHQLASLDTNSPPSQSNGWEERNGDQPGPSRRERESGREEERGKRRPTRTKGTDWNRQAALREETKRGDKERRQTEETNGRDRHQR